MPAYDVSFLNSKARKPAQDYGFLVDQLDILKNRLQSDGKLSPGDYDVLKAQAQKIYVHPGLTPAQRSNIEVKMSQYEQEKKTNTLKDTQDLDRMNNEISNDSKKLAMAFGNDPQTFLKGKLTLTEGKMFRLQENIADLNRAGADATHQESELLKVMDEWTDTRDALGVAEKYKPGDPPNPNFTLYIDTNSHGEIRDIEVGRAGSKQGYLETNGVLGGFSIAGKANAKIASQEGKNVFRLGNTTFSAPSMLRPGPDGTFKQDRLVAESQQQTVGTRGMTKAKSEFFDVMPADVKTQRYTRPGEWIQAEGSLYKQLPDGSYERYIGATPEQLQIDEDSIMKNLPRELLGDVQRRTIKTNDLTPTYTPPVDAGAGLNMSTPTGPIGAPAPTPALSQAASRSTEPMGSARTPSPTTRAPKTGPGIAEQLYGKAKGFLGKLFADNL